MSIYSLFFLYCFLIDHAIQFPVVNSEQHTILVQILLQALLTFMLEPTFSPDAALLEDKTASPGKPNFAP